MEIPIISATPYFDQFMSQFKRFFSCPQFRNATHYLLGLLLCEGRRTISHLSESQSRQGSYNRLHHFLSRSPWNEEHLNEARIRQMMQEVQTSAQDQHEPIGFLIGDDTTNPKRGSKMAGFGLHYSTTEDAVIPSQCVVSTLYHFDRLDVPLYASLYKTKQVCRDNPEVFRTKNDLLVDQIQRTVLPKSLRTIGLFDAWYFNVVIRRACQDKGIEAIGRLNSNRRAILNSKDLIGTRLDDWFHTLRTAPKHPFQKLTLPDSKGHRRQLWMFQATGFIAHLGLVRLVIVSSRIRGRSVDPVFIASTDLHLSAQQIVSFYFQRWSIETFFWTVKEHMGFNHYQVRPERSAKRHWLLCFLAYSYLVSARHLDPQKTAKTLGDYQQREQRENFRHLVHQVCLELKKRRGSVNATCLQLAA